MPTPQEVKEIVMRLPLLPHIINVQIKETQVLFQSKSRNSGLQFMVCIETENPDCLVITALSQFPVKWQLNDSQGLEAKLKAYACNYPQSTLNTRWRIGYSLDPDDKTPKVCCDYNYPWSWDMETIAKVVTLVHQEMANWLPAFKPYLKDA